MKDIQAFHRTLYATHDKIQQDLFILKHCDVAKPKRARPRTNSGSKKSMSITYKVKRKDGLVVPVCRDSFISITGISKNRIQLIMKNFQKDGSLPSERRGGDRVLNKNDGKRLKIKEFIENIKCIESHYCRSTTSVRTYLPCDINIKKLYRAFNNSVPENLNVRFSFFHKYFTNNYNIGFGTPKTDECSTCLTFKEKLKLEQDPRARVELITSQRVHKLRAKAFYEMLQEEKPGLATFSFDCQKNLAMPKVSDQAAYYSRQLYMYNFTIVRGTSKAKLNQQNVFIHAWTEIEHSKSSNEIASAVHNTLSKSKFDNIDKVRLMCDGCGGQNKNTTMIAMCVNWLLTSAPQSVKIIELVYPVPGHSFDRVFGLIEKKIKTKATIILPEEYVNIFADHGTVLRAGTDFLMFDWRSAAQTVLKLPGAWHFKFNAAKRMILTKSKKGIVERGEPHYRSDVCEAKGICKRNQQIINMKPKQIPSPVHVKEEKLRDVGNLLQKHFGDDWDKIENLSYYKNIFNNLYETENVNQCDSVRDIEMCDTHNQEDMDLRVLKSTYRNMSKTITVLYC